jgi:glyoxylase-like metal-dependent hydrolase (beta-lactamase superfamily II)
MFLGMMVLAAGLVFAQDPAAGRGGGGGGRGQGGPGGAGGGGRGGAGGGGGAIAIKPVPNKGGLFMITGAGGTSTVRVGTDGVILVDTKNPGEANYNAILEQIKTVTPQPVKYAVVTHVHQDHAGNVDLFIKGGAQVVAHDNMKKNWETYAAAAGKPMPNSLYTAPMTLRVVGAQAVVQHFGSGHTSADSYVYFQDLRTVATGDAFAGAALNCDYSQGGSILEWSKSLEGLLKLDFDTVIAGHTNDPLTKADVQAAQQRLAKIGTVAIDLVKKGTPKDQLVAAIGAADATLNVGALLQNNATRLDAFYAELQAAAK